MLKNKDKERTVLLTLKGVSKIITNKTVETKIFVTKRKYDKKEKHDTKIMFDDITEKEINTYQQRLCNCFDIDNTFDKLR
jgi:hypothetical protein